MLIFVAFFIQAGCASGDESEQNSQQEEEEQKNVLK